jgi:hypothetical protein
MNVISTNVLIRLIPPYEFTVNHGSKLIKNWPMNANVIAEAVEDRCKLLCCYLRESLSRLFIVGHAVNITTIVMNESTYSAE